MLYLLLLTAHAQAPVPTSEEVLRWANSAEGALVKTGNAAEQLAATAQAVAAEGRLGQLTVLRAAADELVRRSSVLVRYTTSAGTVAP